jgi:mono/diheme cytochrome c family protein
VAEVSKVIAEGAPGTAMVGFKAQLSDDQIAALARYVRAFDKSLKPEKPAKAEKGKK